MEILSSSVFVYGAIFVLGTVVGSYINSWMWRVHEGKWRWGGRSMCVQCGRALVWYENIPLVSFVCLQGRCRTCRAPIPRDYFFVELAVPALLVGLAWYHLGGVGGVGLGGALNPWR